MNEVFEQIKNHRSIRKYLDKDVSESLLEEVLNAGIHASSSGNMQAYSIIVTRSKEVREKFSPLHFNQEMVLEAPVFVTFCADFHRMRKWLEISDAKLNFDNFMSFMSFMIGAIDATLVSQNVALAAESKGLGICYMGTTLANCHEIAKTLDCPENVVPVVGFSLGWPDEKPEMRKRLPLEHLVHKETYKDPDKESILEAYSERNKEGWDCYMKVGSLKKMVEKSGVKNLAQVYSELKYTRESHLEYSDNVLKCLSDQGFMNHEL